MPTKIGQQENAAELLEQLGLSCPEQRLYLYGITVPPQPVSMLAKHVGNTRSNTYNIVYSLEEKGLCWNLGSEYGRKIMFAEPQKLVALHAEKMKQLESLKGKIDQFTETLKKSKYSGPIAQPRVQYFEGKEGVKRLYTDSLNTKEKRIRTALYQGIFERMGKEFVAQYIQERYSRGISNKILYAQSRKAFDTIYGDDPTNNREVRMPPKTITFDSMILIYDSKVAIITMKNEVFGTLIESVDYSSTMKSWFDTIWSVSKE